MIKIDKDIPIPEFSTKASKYPFRQMEIGDSFFVEFPKEATNRELKKTQCSILGSSRCRRFKDGRKFNSQIVNMINLKGVRCWRIK